MAKQVTKTPEMLAQLRKVAGEGVDASNLPVYEAILANTLPIQQRGSLFDKATLTEGTLREMADYINTTGLPLQLIHDTDVLPVGKVFSASTVANAGATELRGLFYVDSTEQKISAKIDNGTVDAVSIGAKQKHGLCSECGFDFFGEEVPFSVLMSRTCPDGHTIGIDGAHLTLSGLDRFYELSLVPQGAIPKAKILDRVKASIKAANANDPTALAAANARADLALFASATLPIPPKETAPMSDLSALVTQLTAATTKATTAELQLATANATIADLTTKLTAETAAKTAALAAGTPATVEEKAKLAAAEKANGEALTFLRSQAKKILVATGTADPKTEDMTLEQAVAAITDGQLKLASLIPAGGAATGAAKPDAPTDADKARDAAFTTNR